MNLHYRNNRFLSFFLLIIFFIILSYNSTCAQEDSIMKNEKDTIDTIDLPGVVHSARKATIYSALVPGLGQVYNKKYVKIPVIYAAFAGLAYAINFNAGQYNRFKTAYLEFPNDEFEGLMQQDQIVNYINEYRRWRDISVIGLVLVWGLNVIDANVDAHFYEYDISPEISLNLKPTYKQNAFGPELGVKLALNF